MQKQFGSNVTERTCGSSALLHACKARNPRARAVLGSVQAAAGEQDGSSGGGGERGGGLQRSGWEAAYTLKKGGVRAWWSRAAATSCASSHTAASTEPACAGAWSQSAKAARVPSTARTYNCQPQLRGKHQPARRAARPLLPWHPRSHRTLPAKCFRHRCRLRGRWQGPAQARPARPRPLLPISCCCCARSLRCGLGTWWLQAEGGHGACAFAHRAQPRAPRGVPPAHLGVSYSPCRCRGGSWHCKGPAG